MAQLYPSSYPDASYCHSANVPSSEAPSPSLYHFSSSSHAHPNSISGLAAPPPPWSASSAGEYEHHFASTAHGSLKRHLPVQEDSYASSMPKRARAESNVGDIPFYSPWIEANAYSAASTSVYPQRPGEKFCTFYMTTSTCSFGVTCRFDHPPWVPAGGIPNWKENTSSNAKADITSLPVRPSEPDCSFYLKTGECKYGSRCKFNHPEDRTAGAVKLKESESQNNEERSPKPEISPGKITQKNPDSVNLNGFPIRNGELDCAFYIKTGSCKYGETCRFNHPEDRSGGIKLPIDINTANKLQDYTVSLPPASVSLSAGTFMPGHPFPLRPGEPECSFYMKTGDCKFKATCRFNHPLNRFDPVYAAKSSVKLNLAGLPRREGQQPCPFYLKTGTCSYKTTCKFDHPSPGEVVAKALASALQAGQDPSVVGSENLPPGVSPTTILS